MDSLLLLLIALTLAGYAVFTWKNPWFVTSKGSFLLCLSIPFAYDASEVLVGWIGVATVVALTVLLTTIVGTFTFSEFFWNTDHMRKPGVLW